MNQIVKPKLVKSTGNIVAGVSGRKLGNMKLGGGNTDKALLNRQKLLEELGVEGRGHLARCFQTHSSIIKKITPDDIQKYNRFWQAIRVKNCDGLITDQVDIWLGVLVADCLPVFIWQEDLFVGSIHAGWRGVLEEITFKAVDKAKKEYGAVPGKIKAYIGPSIGPCHFEVQDGVYSSFQKKFDNNDAFIVKKDQEGERKYIDLWQITSDQLRRAGLNKKNIEVSKICTVCENDSFFSRRGRDESESQMAVIGVKGD